MSRDDPVGADEPMTDAQSGLATVQVPSLATLEAAEVQPWTVLCVDDEPSILSALRRVLRAEGCRLLTAQGGLKPWPFWQPSRWMWWSATCACLAWTVPSCWRGCVRNGPAPPEFC